MAISTCECWHLRLRKLLYTAVRSASPKNSSAVKASTYAIAREKSRAAAKSLGNVHRGSPRVLRLVDRSCQRVFSFDRTVSYGDAPILITLLSRAGQLDSGCLGCIRFVLSWYKRWYK